VSAPQGLARRLGAFDATMIVMGGIIGAGIFRNPAEVARHVGTPTLMLGAWVAGGAIALAGAFVYAELAQRRPETGGQYAYIRDAFHPMAAFLYGWTLLLVTQTGGMAAVAMTFADYLRDLTGWNVDRTAIAIATLLILTLINCLGVRSGSNVQNTLMVMKIVAIVALIAIGWSAIGGSSPALGSRLPSESEQPSAGSNFLAAMVPVLFAYGGWQTASFVSGEMRNPNRDLPRGLLIGVIGVVVLYVSVSLVCILVLGPASLAATPTPASDVMRRAMGDVGGQLMAAGIAISTVGFLSQGMLTAPRVYFAMARDGVFFEKVGTVSARTQAPVIAIALQGVWASVIVLFFGVYGPVLNYVVALDAVFFGLTGAALLVFRRRDPTAVRGLRMPGHPVTTLVFVIAFWVLAASTIAQFPKDAGMGVLILLIGIPVYLFWRRREPRSTAAP
jgi:basic amino acid/polyamine antiporter, APA family